MSADEGTRSLWQESFQMQESGPLETSVICDVCIVGGGIAGLTSAYSRLESCRKELGLSRTRLEVRLSWLFHFRSGKQ